jgi:hypothetical protein
MGSAMGNIILLFACLSIGMANPPLITLMIGVGITPLFFTLPVWWYALQFL